VFHKRSKIENVYGKNYNVLFLGNSRCANSVVPSVFSSQIGLSSFNLGWAAANPRELYAALKIYLSRNTAPAYVFIQIDKNGYDTGISKLAIQPLLKYYNRNIIDEYFPTEMQDKLRIPFYASILYRDFGWREMLKTLLKNENQSILNFGYSPVSGYIKEEFTKNQPFEFSAETYLSNKWFEKIRKISNKKNIKLIFFTAPYWACDNKGLSPISKSDGDFYINLSDFNKNPRLFKDESHLNHEGALLFSKTLGQLSRDLIFKN
jgi:hypothetical protein